MSISLSTSDWEKAVQEALKNWKQLPKLAQSPLVNLDAVASRIAAPQYASDPYSRAKALRDVLAVAIRALGPEDEDPPEHRDDLAWMDAAWRSYSLITLRHVKGIPLRQVPGRLGLQEGGHFYDEQRKAISFLACLLRDQEGYPTEAVASISFSYPSGAVALTDRFYIQRKADHELLIELSQPGKTVTIRGPRQAGKTSLLVRGIQHARNVHGARIVYFDLQAMSGDCLTSLDTFLREFAKWVADDLGLDEDLVTKAWQTKLPPTKKLTNFLSQHILADADSPVFLAMDEIDRLLGSDFHTDFFGLVRYWHNRRAHDSRWENLNLLMAISTEPYLLINDLEMSPFNVGLALRLEDFDEVAIHDLNRRYGSPLPLSEVSQLHALLNGHPFLTRVALYTLVKDKTPWSQLSEIAATAHGPFHDHLARLHQLVVQDPALRMGLREVIASHRCSDTAARFRLLKAGLIKGVGDEYSCRCTLYERYFHHQL